MAALTSQSFTKGATPTPITPSAGSPGSDTIAAGQMGPNGCVLRVITSGTASNVSVLDPNLTALGNPGTVSALAAPATGVRWLPIPPSAVDPVTGNATVTSSSQTGLTYELYRV